MFIMIGQLTSLNSIVFIFGNYIIINKLLNRNELSIGNINFNTDNVYPQTGFCKTIIY